MMKKLGTLLLASALLLSSATAARAQNRWDLTSPLNQHAFITQTPDTEVNFWKYLSAVSSGIIGSLNNQIVAPDAAPSAVSGLGHMIATMTGNPPVRTAQYLAYMGAKAGFVDQAYAQEGGFAVLQPIQSIWVATRNVAYLITSLTLVVIGFMIMMRKKLDAQTVIGIQQALPSIVITLLLITFSYAIAGLVIDLLYFVLYFIVNLLGNNIFEAGGAKKAIDFVTQNSVFTVVLGGLFGAGGVATDTAAKAIAQLIDDLFSSSGIAGVIGSGIGKLLGGSPVGSLIISGALLFTMVKLFFSLLTSYAMLLLSTIFGPLMLMTNAIPGSNAFGTWIKNLLGNAAVFPATAIFIILAAALMGNANTNFGIKPDVGFGSPSATAWAPPLLFGVSSSGASGTSPVDALMALIGLGMLMLTPQFVEMVKKAFSAGGGEGYGSGIGQALQYGYSGRYSPMGMMTGGRGALNVATGGLRTAAGAPFGLMAAGHELKAAQAGGMGAMMHPGAAAANRFGPLGRAAYRLKRGLGL